MAWPKGKSREKKVDEPRIINVPPPKPDYVSDTFQPGQWYAPTELQPIKVNASGQLYRHTVIKFKVVKITGDIVAVQFEDGTFEAMVTPEFDKYTVAQAPKY